MKSKLFPSRRRTRVQSVLPPQLERLEHRIVLSATLGAEDPAAASDTSSIVQDFLFGEGGLLSGVVQASKQADDKGKDDDDEDEDEDDDKDKDKEKDDDEDDDSPKSSPKTDNAPLARIDVGGISSRGGSSHTVTVTYTDDKKIRVRTIGTDDLVVTSPGGPNLTITDVSTTPDKDNDSIVATYTLAAPGGSWDGADNGAYSVTLKPSEVFDTRNQSAESVSATFNVGIVATDTVAPTGVIAAGNITKAGGESHKITVTYTDDIGVNPLSIGPNDLTITGPGGSRTVRSISVNPNSDGTIVTATYTISAPGSAWGPEDNGVYTISITPNQVRDASEKAATAAPASFTVNVPRPEPIDSGFGSGSGTGGGSVKTSFVAEAVTAQADGKLVVAGRQGNVETGSSQAVVQRFNADGTLDTTFATKGTFLGPASTNDAYYSIALGADGSIFVAGTRGGDVLVTKLDANGKFDPSFSKGGNVVTDFGTAADAAYALGVAADGSVVAAGGPDGNFAMAHFLPNGTLDPNFGQGGKQLFDLGADNDVAGAVAFQADGKVVVVGTSGGKVAVVRMRADGEADETFSGDGLLLLDALTARADANFSDHSTAAAIQADGKLLLANRSAGGDFAVARLNANGQLDNSFGSRGVATVDFGGEDDADAILVQDTGEILVIGTTNSGGVANTAVAALSASGQLIADFGAGGKLTLTPDVDTASRELHIGDLVLRAFGTRQSDGRVVIGAANRAPQAVGSSSLRRLNVPGARTAAMGTQLGTFGIAGGKRTVLTVTDADGTKITFSASKGSGIAYESGGKYNLVLSDTGGGAVANVKATGGDGRVAMGDIIVTGALRSFSAKSADLSGTLFASGAIGKLSLGALSGSIASAGAITAVSLTSMTGARIMSGANLGADGKLGGDNADADGFAPGAIGAIRVAGPIEASTISAGLDPVDTVFNNTDDRILGADTSVIRSVFAKSADPTSRFIAGKITSLKLPKTIDLASDERVKIMV